ncbi:Tim44/TimA family putative adaptor protein [Aestuariispira insulae]|uniref:Putative lipid-binding transport protein (Tim44 family) n=1 Tax=Aestuariispira insulae TaxID=1461337 RepID=A0A3D9HPE5_9PROT|nr:Tim44/TimA family putative adaptor protein [Aestuariispira insulae]RED51373.1 putative lipid-binding transport protein (Tim44 family) [Aestuariispira insulae]
MSGTILELVFLAAVAVFLIFRLGSVLGKRTGHERRPSDFGPADSNERYQQDEDNIVNLPSLEERQMDEKNEALLQGPLGEEFKTLIEADPSFRPVQFLDGAAGAFEMILQAYVEGDQKTLKQLLSADVFENFAKAIRDREAAGQRIEDTLVGIDNIEFLEARLEGRTALVTIKIISKQVNVLFNPDGSVADGDDHKVITVTDIWTFSRDTRSKDPNWVLVATRSPN